MNKTAFMFASALATATVVQAETVLWYHFDEAEPGTLTTTSSVIVDAAGTQNGIPEYYWNEGKGSNAAYMPAYSNAFPNGCVWFDPVSGARGSLNRCLHIKNPPNRGQYGNGEHGVVRIPDNAKLHLQTFTVEMFVKDLYLSDPEHTEVRNSPSSNHRVLYKKNSWSVEIPGGNGNGSDAVVKGIYRDVDGTATYWSDGVNGNMYPRTQRDGNWHHVALVVDGTDQTAVKVEVYVDYIKQYNASKTMTGPVYYDTSDIFIGFCESNNGGWGGLIDEFRVSDAVLAPTEMLRFVNPKTDADTLLYLSFDNWMGNLFKYNPCGNSPNNSLVNESGNTNSAKPSIALRSTDLVPEYLADSAGALLRRDIAANAFADTCCLHPVTNTAHQTLGISYPLTGDRIVTKDDFTIEMFVKCPVLPTVDEYLMRNASVFAADGKSYSWYITASTAGKVTFAVNWQKGMGATTSSAVLSDGEWHHLAWVTEKATNTCRFYVDYEKIGEFSDATWCPITPAAATDAGKLIFASYAENGQNSNSYSGYLDDIRVTGRALEPQEFLTTRSPATAVLASASFENNLNEGPADLTDLFAEGTLTGTGSYALSRPFKSDANRKSIRLNGATVNLGRNILLEQNDAFTLEFFLRPESLGGEANIVALKKPAPSDADVWSVSLSADKSTLTVRAGVSSAAFALPAIADWWHHYGLVFTKSGGLPVVTLYVDHVQIGEPAALSATFDFSAHSRGLVVGSEALTGWVDEVRVSKGALAVEDMMACGPRSGFLLQFR